MDRKWWTLAAVCFGVFMLLLDVTIVNVALPDIGHAFNAPLSDLQWVIDAYALTLAAFELTAGSLADLFGRRRLFAIGITVFTVGSLLCGLANSALFLALSRAGQGVGGAVMFAVAFALIGDAFRGRDRAAALGILGAVTGIGVAVGPVLGGVITSALSWRWIFFVNVPIGVAVLAVTLLRVSESRDPDAGRPDLLGFVTFSGALTALVFGLIRSSADGWGSTTVIASLAGAGALLLAFIAAEMLQRTPMFDLSLLRKPTFTGGLVAAFGMNGTLFAMFTFLVLYLQNVLGYSANATGIRLLVVTGAIFVVAGIAGGLSNRVPTRWLIGPGLAAVGVGLLLMRGLSSGSDWTHLIPGLVVAGVGAGMVNVPLANTAIAVIRPERAGMASGMNSTLRQVGTATGIALYGSIFSNRLQHTVVTNLAHTPLASAAPSISSAVTGGNAGRSIAATPGPLRATAGLAVRNGFVTGLNDILLVSAIAAFAAAALSFVTIRQRDFIYDPTAAEPERSEPERGETERAPAGAPHRAAAPAAP